MGKTDKCRKCGCPMEMAMGPNGRFIPVQKVTMVYQKLGEVLEKLCILDASAEEVKEFYVSHFQTCSDPARFSRKSRG